MIEAVSDTNETLNWDHHFGNRPDKSWRYEVQKYVFVKGTIEHIFCDFGVELGIYLLPQCDYIIEFATFYQIVGFPPIQESAEIEWPSHPT